MYLVVSQRPSVIPVIVDSSVSQRSTFYQHAAHVTGPRQVTSGVDREGKEHGVEQGATGNYSSGGVRGHCRAKTLSQRL